MEWLMPSWLYWWTPGGPPAMWGWTHDEAVPASRVIARQRHNFTTLDLCLIQVAYEVIAAESNCTRCGAPLDRRPRIMPSAADHPPSWNVSIATRCRGWKRHRHIATVDDASTDLVLGRFHAD
jgi:hypothetical protein